MVSKAIDYTGKRIGSMTVLSRVPDINRIPANNNYLQWYVKCDCGKEVILNSKNIRRTPNRSCGCQRQVHAPLFSRDPKQTNINNHLAGYKASAKIRNIEWQLNKQEFTHLILQNCYYCGLEPSITHNVYNTTRYRRAVSEQAIKRQKNGLIKMNGIDRVDSKKGYLLDNCVPCCKDCNYGKLTKTKDEFLQWINRIVTHQNKQV